MNEIIQRESARTILGIEGRAFNVVADKTTGRIVSQTWGTSLVRGDLKMEVDLRFDDNCNNKHSSFSVTGSIYKRYKHGAPTFRREPDTCGCIHEEIASWFPALAPLIQWHLCSTDSPMHYVANVVYLAGDRDCWGLRKGETRQLRNGKTGELSWIREAPRTEYFNGPTPPSDVVTLEWKPWCRIGEGKVRELDKARHAAIWPEATDEQLCSEPEVLTQMLKDRLPALTERFRHAMTVDCGFLWEIPAAP